MAEQPMVTLAGRCPACNGSSLFAAAGGHITCSRLDCPNPTAVADLLEGPDEHFVTFDSSGWFVEHSFPCRVAGEMKRGCRYQRAVEAAADEPDEEQFGRWRITEIDSEGMPALERADG